MNTWKDASTDRLVKAMLSLKNEEECYAFLEDLCTITEILDMSKRLLIAGMLVEKMSYTDIMNKTKVSTATISRISKCCEYGCGGYTTVLERLKDEKND